MKFQNNCHHILFLTTSVVLSIFYGGVAHSLVRMTGGQAWDGGWEKWKLL